ncbi:MAG TPA: pilus assembly protein [Allosphingosinicella sp.]|uniref:pilus assembly protein n=1 Tax=Allosphingosinicella sp. TaxID=2823234 RepID=UPI002ED99B86
MGVRYAVATDMIPAGLATYSFATDGGLVQGEPVPESAFGGATCTSAGCTCKATCPALDENLVVFNNIVARMQLFMPEIGAENVQVDYDYSGLGYAGDPNGPDVAPLVTVSLTDLSFQPLTLIAFQRTIILPDFRSALTLEDGDGSFAN